jgi:hypothetical protein
VVESGLQKLNWRSSGINEFICDSMNKIQAVDEVVKTMKNNLSAVDGLMKVNNSIAIKISYINK